MNVRGPVYTSLKALLVFIATINNSLSTYTILFCTDHHQTNGVCIASLRIIMLNRSLFAETLSFGERAAYLSWRLVVLVVVWNHHE